MYGSKVIVSKGLTAKDYDTNVIPAKAGILVCYYVNLLEFKDTHWLGVFCFESDLDNLRKIVYYTMLFLVV
jgi:hypothetical protein